MIIPCINWSDCGDPIGGRCAVGLHYGRPSLGGCAVCRHANKSPTDPGILSQLADEGEQLRRLSDPSFLQRLAHGAIGLGKAMIGVDRAGDETIAARRQTCAGCDQSTVLAGVANSCKACGCFWSAKILTNGERCPLKKW